MERFQIFSETILSSPRTLLLLSKTKGLVSRLLVGTIIGKWICTIFLFVYFLFFFFPTIIPVYCILYAYRSLLSLYKSYFRPDLGNFLTGIGSILGSEDPYKSPRANISGYFILEGDISLEEVTSTFSSKLQPLWNQNLYRELRQQLTTFSGFSIWQDEEHFSIDKHIRELSSSFIKSRYGFLEVDEQDVINAVHKFSNLPYDMGLSPWDIHIIRGVGLKECKGPISVMVLRFHHTLGDGFAMMKLTSEIMLDEAGRNKSRTMYIEAVERAKADVVKVRGPKSPWQMALNAVTTPVVSVFELAQSTVFSWDIDFFKESSFKNHNSNGWSHDSSSAGEDYIYVTTQVPTELIKNMKNRHGVTFSSVSFAAVSRALRRFTRRHFPEVKLPEAIHAVVSVPLPVLELRLSNDVTNSFISLPVGSSGSPVDLMQQITAEQTELKKSNVILARLAFAQLVGMLPKACIKILGQPTLGVTTNFPGYNTMVDFAGRRINKLAFLAGIPSDIGFYLWIFTYDKWTKISIGFRPDIVRGSHKNAAEFVQLLQEEFKNMNTSQ